MTAPWGPSARRPTIIIKLAATGSKSKPPSGGPGGGFRRIGDQMSEAKTTQDHDTIRKWAETRGGKPSAVAEIKNPGDPGILRLDFDPKDKALDVLSWGEF